MAPHLLSLPPELRNTIFKLALTDPDGVIYRESDQGAWRLCLPEVTQEALKAIQDTKIAKELRRAARGISAKNLEGSIHSAIKEYAGAFKARKAAEANWDIVRFEGSVVANQLHYVCRQLRYEARGMVARCNTIRFHPATFIYDLGHVTEFLDNCPPIHKDRLRTLRIRPQEPSKAHNLCILDLAEQYPELAFELHVIQSAENQLCLFDRLLYLKYWFRDDIQYFQKYPKYNGLQKLWADIDEIQIQIPCNVRFFPWDPLFDEASFRSENLLYYWNSVVPPYFNPYERIDEMAQMVKDWYANGI